MSGVGFLFGDGIRPCRSFLYLIEQIQKFFRSLQFFQCLGM